MIRETVSVDSSGSLSLRRCFVKGAQGSVFEPGRVAPLDPVRLLVGLPVRFCFTQGIADGRHWVYHRPIAVKGDGRLTLYSRRHKSYEEASQS